MTDVSDSYCATIEEASAILAQRAGSATWLASSMQAVALQEATQAIDALPLRGERYEPAYIYNGSQKDVNSDGLIQTLEFPRFIDGILCDYDYGTQKPIVPSFVKRACALEALAIVVFNAKSSNAKRKALQDQGVKSYSIGDLSESFGARSAMAEYGLQSPEAYNLLKIYIDTTASVL